MYLWKLALRPWRLAPLSQAFSSLAVGFLLLLVGFLFWMQQGLKPLLVRLHGEQVVTAYLEPSVSGKEADGLVRQIRSTLNEQSGFKAQSKSHPKADVQLITASQFIVQLKNKYPELGRELEQMGNEKDFIVPSYISVSGILPNTALDEIKKLRGVDSAESSKDRYRTIVGAFSALRTISRVLMSGICLALLTGLIHLTRMNSYLQQDALALLQLWGAGKRVLSHPRSDLRIAGGVARGSFCARRMGEFGGLGDSATSVVVSTPSGVRYGQFRFRDNTFDFGRSNRNRRRYLRALTFNLHGHIHNELFSIRR